MEAASVGSVSGSAGEPTPKGQARKAAVAARSLLSPRSPGPPPPSFVNTPLSKCTFHGPLSRSPGGVGKESRGRCSRDRCLSSVSSGTRVHHRLWQPQEANATWGAAPSWVLRHFQDGASRWRQNPNLHFVPGGPACLGATVSGLCRDLGAVFRGLRGVSVGVRVSVGLGPCTPAPVLSPGTWWMGCRAEPRWGCPGSRAPHTCMHPTRPPM